MGSFAIPTDRCADDGKEENLDITAECSLWIRLGCNIRAVASRVHRYFIEKQLAAMLVPAEPVFEDQKQGNNDPQFLTEDLKEWRSGWSDSDSESVNMTESKLMRRIDWRLLPWMCVLYALSLIDRYIPRFWVLTDGKE